MIRKLYHILLFFAVVATVGGFWYVRAAGLKANPVWPLTLVWRGEVVFQGIQSPLYRTDQYPGHHIPDDIKADLERDKWATVFKSWVTDPWGPMAESSKSGGFGPVLGAICIPALAMTLAIAFVRRRPDWRVGMFVLCWAVSYAVFPFPIWARFAMPAMTVLLVALGYVMEYIDK